MNLYTEDDYRTLLVKVVEERKRLDPQVTFQRLAEAMRVPKSYLSRVLHGKADLSTDQAFQAARHLEFTAEESTYLLLLLEYARSGVKERRHQLLQQIREIQSRHQATEMHLKAPAVSVRAGDLAEYYLHPLLQRTHVCLRIPRYRQDLDRLAVALRISLPRLQTLIVSLERMGLIRRLDGQLELLVETLHLPKTSPLYRPWRNQLKMASLARADTGEQSEDYSFADVFSANETACRQVQARFLEFLKGIEELVADSPQEDVYQMGFELYPWTR